MKKILATSISVILLFSILIVPGVQAQEEITAQALNTPFSIDSTSGGFQIPKGSTITKSANGDIIVTNPNGRPIFKTNDSLSEMVSTPNGPCKASHVYHVPSESSVWIDNNKLKIYFNDELILQIIDYQIENKVIRARDSSDSWIEWAAAYMGNVDFYWGVWSVPSSPPSPGDSTINYLFNALTIPNCILQPVLEWNYDDSDSWTCAAWFGIDFGGDNEWYVRATNPKSASPGNVIRGTMAWDTDHWYISIINNSTGQYSNLYCYNIQVTSGMSAHCSLEGYNIDGNEDVPGDTTFSALSIRYDGSPKTPSWSANYNIPEGVTGMSVQIISSSSVKLNTAN